MIFRSSVIRVAALAAIVLAGAAAGPQAFQESAAGKVRMQRLRLSTGVELQVALGGRRDGEPVLFLHGFTDSWFSYSAVLAELPDSIRAIAPTQRGHGDSERPACCYRLQDLAADAVALLDALNIPRATVVGHSMGSFVAQRVATDHPDRVSRLVLIGSGTRIDTPPVVEFNGEVQKLADPVALEFARAFQESTIFKPIPPAFLDTAIAESLKLPARVWRDVLAGLLAPDALRPQARIQAPTLIVWGDRDALWQRSDQDALTAAIRGSRLLVYRDIGHAPQWEDPSRFVADLRDFLGTRVSAVASPEQHRHDSADHHAHRPAGPVPLLSGLGDWEHRISTGSPEAQRYFNQGLRLAYGFNHDEAARSFERAVELDPQCAMCHWGIAYAIGPNINLPMDASMEPRAHAAIQRAVDLKARTTPLEQALIDAMAARFGAPAGAARAERDAAYADAMRGVAQRFADDVDTQVLFADAMLNLRPWNQWTRDGRPQPGTTELVAALEGAIARQPHHAGACHFYIHAVEGSETPERALPCAERLPRLMPGAGHVVHMPAHVYLRVGRYEEAARANLAAVAADNHYLARPDASDGFYPMFYAPHNLHFLWSTYMLSGQHAKALNVSRALAGRVALEDARQVAALEGFLQAPVLTLVRFGEWDAVLAEPAPPADLQYVTGIWHYARGMAFAARRDFVAASGELATLRGIAGRVKDDMIIILQPAPRLLALAAAALAGDISARQGQFDNAITHLQNAVAIEDTLTYDEPPPWYHSTRNMLGEALLAAGRAPEAEAAFRDDLRVLRETGWSLSGLERALRAQGRARDAGNVAQRFSEAWKYADAPAARPGR